MSFIKHFSDEFGSEQITDIQDTEISKLRKENKLLRKIIFGGKKRTGMMSHTDPYYRGCWDKLIAKVKK